jgi:hypothetical protein
VVNNNKNNIGNMKMEKGKRKYSATVMLDISAKTKRDLEAEIEKIKAYGAGKAVILTSE